MTEHSMAAFSNKPPVYLDYNATTPLAPSVVDAIGSALVNDWANPSSTHCLGKKAKAAIEKARKEVALVLQASASEIIFTSGGTESNNMALHSAVQSFDSRSPGFSPGATPHIVITSLEHDSVRCPARHLAQTRQCDLTVVEPQKCGAVRVDDVINALTPCTVLVSVMHAHNETGVIQPIELISRAIKAHNAANNSNVLLHVDASQSVGKIAVNVNSLGADYLTLAGHKIYGPRIGALYVRNLGRCEGAPLSPLLLGGGQELGYRSGTENTPMIVGLGEACRLVERQLHLFAAHMEAMRDYLEKRMTAYMEEKNIKIVFLGRSNEVKRLPNTSMVAIEKSFPGHSLINQIPIAVSGGAACHSGAGGPSAALLAMGMPSPESYDAIRYSVGRETTKADIDHAVEATYFSLVMPRAAH